MVSEDIYIVFEKVVRIEAENKPELDFTKNKQTLSASDFPFSTDVKTSPIWKNNNLPSETSINIDDNLQITTSNDLDYDFGLDEMSDLYISDNLEGIGTESPGSDRVLIEEKKEKNRKNSYESKIDKALSLERKTSSRVQKRKKESFSSFSSKVVKIMDRIVRIDHSVSKHLRDIIDRAPSSDIKKMNFDNTIELLMQTSFIVHDYSKFEKNSSSKNHKVAKYLQNCLKCYVDNGNASDSLLTSTTSIRLNCIPSTNYISFEKWTNESGELFLEKIGDVAIGKVTSPLGCAYDSKLGFLFTGFNEILSCSVNGVMSTESVIDDLNNPTAIAVINPGELIGVLDRDGIYIYDLKRMVRFIVADDLKSSCRGLAVTKDGFILTCGRLRGIPSVIMYNPAIPNTVVNSMPFPVISGYGSSPNPCFITARDDIAYITDLGQNCIVCIETKLFVLRFSLPLGKTSSCTSKFQFISGIVMDSRGNLLIADAQNRNLHYLNGQCSKSSVVRVLNGSFPYSAAFDVSSSGHLLACCRKSNSMMLFKTTNGSQAEKYDSIAFNSFGMEL